MNSDRYKVGTRLKYNDGAGTVGGTVIDPEELHRMIPGKIILAGDVCVKWDNLWASTYDEEWLDENTEM